MPVSSRGFRRKVVIHFQSFGPYHLARLASASDALAPLGYDVVGLEIASSDQTYQWSPRDNRDDCIIHTLFPGQVLQDIPNAQVKKEVNAQLDLLSPATVAIAGWSSVDALACLAWCRRNHRIAILMSETRYVDGPRRWLREVIKSRRIRTFSGALVGGRSHADYLSKLHFTGHIKYGYDIIDNDYFHSKAFSVRQASPPCEPYLLASNRFIPRKNLLRLLEAFSTVSSKLLVGGRRISLCLLGDGAQSSELLNRCRQLDLVPVLSAPWDYDSDKASADSPVVFFPGFQQIDQLPRFYALATAFIHPALSEPWGLVINEAMASGLPVLSSTNVGAAEELVIAGKNGYLFNPLSVESIAASIDSLLSLNSVDLIAMGTASFQLVQQRCSKSAFGLGLLQLLSALDQC